MFDLFMIIYVIVFWQELQCILAPLLESIFGFGNQPGWGIGRISKSNSYDFNAVRELLHPNGSLLRLVHRLMAEPFRYEFPFMCLPVRVVCVAVWRGEGFKCSHVIWQLEHFYCQRYESQIRGWRKNYCLIYVLGLWKHVKIHKNGLLNCCILY